MYRSVPYLRERHMYSLSMPNSLNFAFHYHIFVQVLPAPTSPSRSMSSCTVKESLKGSSVFK